MPTSGTPPAGGGASPPELVRARSLEGRREARVRKQADDALRQSAAQAKDDPQLAERLEKALDASGHAVRIEAALEEEPVLFVIDKQTGEVIREVPMRELRRIADSLEKLRGLFLDRVG